MTPGRRVLCAVALGGAVGATMRAVIEANLGAGSAPTSFPWSTLAINAVGSFLLGALSVWGTPLAWWVKPFAGTGVLGGFTTFSAYAVAADALLLNGSVGAGLGYVVATPLLCIAAAALGTRLPSVLGLQRGSTPAAAGQE